MTDSEFKRRQIITRARIAIQDTRDHLWAVSNAALRSDFGADLERDLAREAASIKIKSLMDIIYQVAKWEDLTDSYEKMEYIRRGLFDANYQVGDNFSLELLELLKASSPYTELQASYKAARINVSRQRTEIVNLKIELSKAQALLAASPSAKAKSCRQIP